MKAKIKIVKPRRYRKLDEIDFSTWEMYTGMTEEQENFYKKTYFDYLTKPGRIKEKFIYFCQN